MPYSIRKKGSGFKVCKKAGGKCFSKKPMPKEKAKAQMRAIYANESVKEPRFDSLCSKLLHS